MRDIRARHFFFGLLDRRSEWGSAMVGRHLPLFQPGVLFHLYCSSPHEVQDKHNNGHDEHDVDQPSRDMESEEAKQIEN